MKKKKHISIKSQYHVFRVLLPMVGILFIGMFEVNSLTARDEYTIVSFPGYQSEIPSRYVYQPENPKLIPPHKIVLAGILYRPEGPGPFPAAVIMHGCAGITPKQYKWAEKLKSWGYVALVVDSFLPRNISQVCSSTSGLYAHPQYIRVPDAYAAKAYLKGLPFVDKERIVLLGWSHGAATTLFSVNDSSLRGRVQSSPFAAAVAFYPYCQNFILELNAPLLILIGEEDDWTPASRCKRMKVDGQYVSDYKLVVYPKARHSFDSVRQLHTYSGHLLGRHQESAEKAVAEVKQFLSKYIEKKK